MPELVELHDSASGTLATIDVTQGFNCFRLAARQGDKLVEVLYAHPDFAAGGQRPSGSGIPILFPYPGRLPGMTFSWQGRDYPQEAGDPHGNAIHGFVLRRAWRVLEQSATRVVGEFHAWRDDPSLRERWPADFRIRAEYELKSTALALRYTIDNPDSVPLPCGFGIHPYFRVPLGGTQAADCVVRLPVSSRWELAGMLPTGNRIELADAAAYQNGQTFGGLTLDDVFSGIPFRGDSAQASIADPDSGRTMSLTFDNEFRECVVYTPPHREAICIEPLTCAPAAAWLGEQGIDAGWRVLAPGESFTAAVEIRLD
ncbi:MAG: aldose 1-epimerase [Pirellulaceae bacterium]|nr:aldose 1-epimerase [Pirellulaceae bacterium]